MAKQVMPPAQLEKRSSDVPATDEQLMKISLFAQLKRKPSLDKFPGTLVLRRYRKGDVIVPQGEVGWTAFYALTAEDALPICQELAKAAEGSPGQNVWQTLARNQVQHQAAINQNPNDPELRRVATARLTLAGVHPTAKGGLLPTVRSWFGGGNGKSSSLPWSIPIDAPHQIDGQTMAGPVYEGDLFGENSCRNGTPRSVTIVAERECFMLEMLRNILDQLQKDAAYKARTDDAYKKNLLKYQRRASIFADLSDKQFEAIQPALEVVIIEPGELVYDEYEAADALYLVQRGMVKVVKKASTLIGSEHVRKWPDLTRELAAAAKGPPTPRQRLWENLGEPARIACESAAAGRALTEENQRTILQAINAVIKDRKLATSLEFSKIARSQAFQDKLQEFGLPAGVKSWTEQDWRHHNRLLVDEALSGLIRSHRRRVGPDCVIYYCSSGDFIGELSVMGPPLRSETCLAMGHPKDVGTSKDSGPVELIRVPAEALRRLLDEAPALRARLERQIADRRKRTQEQVRVPVWDDSREVLLSEKALGLGLIQGQKLMLIDLNRCTRCDECVRACVDTHDDGRSRLFLDGPRFGKYLVPATCRSCLDPVCMVGCPVGSIHRGDNGQMVIEDWCIGCGLCAQQCPYGALQMHDIGVVAENERGWRYLPMTAVGTKNWTARRFRDGSWCEGVGPFVNDRSFRDVLAPWMAKAPAPAPELGSMRSMSDISFSKMRVSDTANFGQPICFRLSFRLTRAQAGKDSQLKLTVTTKDPELAVWVNGQELKVDEKASGGKNEYWLPPRPKRPERRVTHQAAPHPRPTLAQPAAAAGEPEVTTRPEMAPNPLRTGWNVLAIRVSPDCNPGGPFLAARLDELRKPTVASAGAEEVTQKQVSERAVVCDLCSGSWGQVPACVNACPHDAAMRVDARSEFPTQ